MVSSLHELHTPFNPTILCCSEILNFVRVLHGFNSVMFVEVISKNSIFTYVLLHSFKLECLLSTFYCLDINQSQKNWTSSHHWILVSIKYFFPISISSPLNSYCVLTWIRFKHSSRHKKCVRPIVKRNWFPPFIGLINCRIYILCQSNIFIL